MCQERGRRLAAAGVQKRNSPGFERVERLKGHHLPIILADFRIHKKASETPPTRAGCVEVAVHHLSTLTMP